MLLTFCIVFCSYACPVNPVCFALHIYRFALYAAGVVRAKNLVAILIKSFTDTCIAALVFYAIGYGFQVGLHTTDPKSTQGKPLGRTYQIT